MVRSPQSEPAAPARAALLARRARIAEERADAMIRRIGSAHALCTLIALGTVTGCNSPLPVAEVEGVVQFADKPLPHVRIQFLPDPEKGTQGPISSAATDEQGRFKMVCADGRVGAIVG